MSETVSECALRFASAEDCRAEYLRLSADSGWERNRRVILARILHELVGDYPGCQYSAGNASGHGGRVKIKPTLARMLEEDGFPACPPAFLPSARARTESVVCSLVNWMGRTDENGGLHTFRGIRERAAVLDLVLCLFLPRNHPRYADARAPRGRRLPSDIDTVNSYLCALGFSPLYLLDYGDFCAMTALKLGWTYPEYRDMLDKPSDGRPDSHYAALESIYAGVEGRTPDDLGSVFRPDQFHADTPTQYYLRFFDRVTSFGSPGIMPPPSEMTVCSFYRRFFRMINRTRFSSYRFLHWVLTGQPLAADWYQRLFPRGTEHGDGPDPLTAPEALPAGIRQSDSFLAACRAAQQRSLYKEEAASLAKSRTTVFAYDIPEQQEYDRMPGVPSRSDFLKSRLVHTRAQRLALHAECVTFTQRRIRTLVKNYAASRVNWKKKAAEWAEAREACAQLPANSTARTRETIFDERNNSLETCWRQFLLYKASPLTQENLNLQEAFYDRLAGCSGSPAAVDDADDMASELFRLRSVSKSTMVRALIYARRETILSLSFIDDEAELSAYLAGEPNGQIAEDLIAQINSLFTGMINGCSCGAGLGFSELNALSSPLDFLLLAAIRNTDYKHLSEHPFLDYVSRAAPEVIREVRLP